MKEKATSTIMLSLLLTSMLGLALTIRPVAARMWINYAYLPSPDQVDMVYWNNGIRNYLNVTVRVYAGTYWKIWSTYPTVWSYQCSDSYSIGFLDVFKSSDHEINATCLSYNIHGESGPVPGNFTGDTRTWQYYSHTYDLGYLKSGSYIANLVVVIPPGVGQSPPVESVSFTVVAPPPISATVSIYPEGDFVTVYIELPGGYNAGDINTYSIRLNGSRIAAAVRGAQIGDYNNNGIPDLDVNYSRYGHYDFIFGYWWELYINIRTRALGITSGNVSLTITGELSSTGMGFEGTAIVSFTNQISATVNAYPDGRWITTYIELPQGSMNVWSGYSLNDIDASGITLNHTMTPDLNSFPPQIGDYNNNGIPDLMVKFNRTEVESFIQSQGFTYGSFPLIMTGRCGWDIFKETATVFILPPINAAVYFDPNVLNSESTGTWITAYIQLPQGYDASAIDAATILLNNAISPVLDPKYGFVTKSKEYLVDHNHDGILERMVKFDRATVESFIHNQGITYGNFSLTITGDFPYSWATFKGTAIISVNQ